MSWKGFTKAINRLPALLSKSVGGQAGGGGLDDKEFDALEAEFKLVESLAHKLSEDTRKFKDALSLMLHHQAELAHLFTAIYTPLTVNDQVDPTDPRVKTALEFSSAMTEAKTTLQSDLLQLERLVVAPTTDYISILDHIKRVIVKRSHKLLDYDRYSEQVKSLRDKPNRSLSDEKRLAGLEATFDEASRTYNGLNLMLKQDLAIFLSLRISFIDPCLLTFYNYQSKVYDTLYRIYYAVATSFTNFDLSTTALGGYQAIQESCLAMLETLTVCKALARPPPGAPGSGSMASGMGGPAPSSSATNAGMVGSLPPSYSQTLSAKQPGMVQQRSSYDDSNANNTGGNGVSRLDPGSSMGRKSMDDALTTQNTFGQPTPAPAQSSGGKKDFVLALYDFEAQAQGDLSFHKDDVIEVLERREDVEDWWTGRIGERVGSFPGNYVTNA